MVSVGGQTRSAQGRASGVDGEGPLWCDNGLGSVAYVASCRVLRGSVQSSLALEGEGSRGALQLRPTDPLHSPLPAERLASGASRVTGRQSRGAPASRSFTLLRYPLPVGMPNAQGACLAKHTGPRPPDLDTASSWLWMVRDMVGGSCAGFGRGLSAALACDRMTLPRLPTPKHLAALAALATLPLTPLQSAGAGACAPSWPTTTPRPLWIGVKRAGFEPWQANRRDWLPLPLRLQPAPDGLI